MPLLSLRKWRERKESVLAHRSASEHCERYRNVPSRRNRREFPYAKIATFTSRVRHVVKELRRQGSHSIRNASVRSNPDWTYSLPAVYGTDGAISYTKLPCPKYTEIVQHAHFRCTYRWSQDPSLPGWDDRTLVYSAPHPARPSC